MNDGSAEGDMKSNSHYVWPVRGGQSKLLAGSFLLTVTKSGTGSGTVAASTQSLAWNGNTGKALYNGTATETLTATAEASSTFSGWSGACSGTQPTCTINVDAAKNATASFAIKTFSIAPTATNGGTISCEPLTVSYGAATACSVTPEAGYYLYRLAENGTAVTGPPQGNTFTLASVTADRAIAASFVPIGTHAINMLPTGQTSCHDASGNAIPCAGTGQDGAVQAGPTPSGSRFTDNGDGTVTDNLTSLVWTQDGNAPGPSTCNPTRSMFWASAQSYISCLNSNNYLGHNDWRLPNVNELNSMVNVGQTNSAVWANAQGFLNVQAGHYWSSTSWNNRDRSGRDPANIAWSVDMWGGVVMHELKSYVANYVWPVRAGRCWPSAIAVACVASDAPSPRLLDNGDLTLTDKLTGLGWAKDADTPGPAACNPKGTRTWQQALDHVACLNANRYLGHDDWRLPNRHELVSLVDYSDIGSDSAFPSFGVVTNAMGTNGYWSSSTFSLNPADAWWVGFGKANFAAKTDPNYVWPVRGGQVLPQENSTTTTSTTSTSTSTTSTAAADSTTTTTTTASTTTTTLGGTVGAATLNLVTGWNLVGNSADASLDVATAFGDSTKVNTVWKWVADGAKWAFYAPSLVGQALADYAAAKGYEVLSAIAGGEGFWVNAKATFTAHLPAGTAISSASYQNPSVGTGRLVKGWNLIAIGDNKTPSEFNKALSAVSEPTEIPLNNLTTLWAWDSTQTNWYFYAPSLEKNGGLGAYIQQKSYLDFGTKALDPSTGFWVNKP